MKMRWAWTLPLLSSLAVTVVTSSSHAQGPMPEGYAAAPGAAGASPFMDPAALAAMQQAQYGQFQPYPQMAAMPMMIPPGMSPQMAPPGMAPPGMMGPGMMPPGMSPYGADPASYMGGPPPGGMPPGYPGSMPQMGGPTPDAFGAYGNMPTDYASDMQGGTECAYCGGKGCDACKHLRHGHHGEGGLLGNLLGCVGPYPDGGCGALRWYDFAVDFMSLKRDNTGRNLATTSLGIAGPIVLQTDQLNFDYEPSFRFSGVVQAGPGSNIEFTYFGLFNYTDSALVRRPGLNDLYSVYSQFGLVPPGIPPAGGFPETDQSDFQQIIYQSTFDSFEVNFRQRWMAANCRYQGSWLCGARHFILDEKFTYNTQSSLNGGGLDTSVDPPVADPQIPATSRTVVDTTNNLTGFQIGGDLWACLLPGLRVGGEAKAGVYGNHMNANTHLTTNTGFTPFIEQNSANDVAFIYEADILATYRLNDQWTIRGGYNFVFVDGVALAPENFNTSPPFGPGRVPFVDDDGELFLHGWNVGVEFMW